MTSVYCLNCKSKDFRHIKVKGTSGRVYNTKICADCHQSVLLKEMPISQELLYKRYNALK